MLQFINQNCGFYISFFLSYLKLPYLVESNSSISHHYLLFGVLVQQAGVKCYITQFYIKNGICKIRGILQIMKYIFLNQVRLVLLYVY